MRTIVIGDLQGCYDDAILLLEKCKVTKSDRVIFAGDLVDRGPDNDKCVDLAMLHESVLGNHEEKHLRYRAKEKAGKNPNVTAPTHVATRLQLKDHHYDYMEKLPLYIRLPEYNAVVVHAGVFPGRKIEEQEPKHLLHVQMINPKVSNETKWPSKVPDDTWKFWTHYWDGPERVIFGHTVLDKPLLTDKVCGIDGGGCFGRQLHAVILPQWEIVSVDCAKDYGKGRRGSSTVDIASFPIHGDVSTYS